MIAFDLLASTRELEAIASEWNDLAAADLRATPYQTAAVTLALWRVFAPQVAPRVVTCRDGDRLIGILPTGIHRRRIGPVRMRVLAPLVLWHGSYFDAVLAPSGQADIPARLLEHLYQAAGHWDALNLAHLRDESNLIAASPMPPGIHRSLEGARFELPLQAAAVEVSGHDRREIRRLRRRLAESFPDAEYTVVTEPGEVAHAAGQFARLHAQRWPSPPNESPFGAAGTIDAFTQELPGLAQEGLAELHVVRAGARLLAAICALRWRGVSYLWRVATDPSLPEFGLGIDAFERAIQTAVARGDRCCDFGRGAEPYKRTWPVETRTLFRVRAGGDGIAWRVTGAAGRLAGRNWTEKWLRGG